MKAAVCRAFGEPLVVEELELGAPQRGEVRVKIKAAAICHSDVHIIRGEWGGEPPIVAGHEAAGVVEEVGEGVTTVAPGDRVVVTMLRSCGRCVCCTTGYPYQCEGDFALKTEHRMTDAAGDPVGMGLNTSAFGEYTIVDQSQLAPVPEDFPMEQAALLSCGVITGFGAVVRTAKVPFGSSVVVLGVGGVGLNAVQGAVASGAYPIIAVDLLDSKLEAAKQFGATHTIRADEDAPEAAVMEITGGRGADYAFITVGSTAAVEQGFRMIGKQGTEVLVGIPETGAAFSLPAGGFVGSEKRMMGSKLGSTRLAYDIPKHVAAYEEKKLKLDELITNRYPLEEINEAIESMERGEALRNVVVFE
jgi:S-(hydroxymethyl)glutathione dehydrogenase / alcohol dehydrogenase